MPTCASSDPDHPMMSGYVGALPSPLSLNKTTTERAAVS
jgi:hypothetical protein